MMSDLVSLVVRRAAIIRIDAAFRLSVRRIRHAVRIEPVSRRCLPKTGIFQIFAGDYRRFGSRSGQFRSPETDSQFAKARYWRAFLRLLRVESPGAGLGGWRRSADHTRLHWNSLLTGNFTGNFAILGLRDTI